MFFSGRGGGFVPQPDVPPPYNSLGGGGKPPYNSFGGAGPYLDVFIIYICLNSSSLCSIKSKLLIP